MTTRLNMPSEPKVAARVGVLLYDTSVEVDAILSSAVEHLRARGVTVGGLLQRFGEQLPNGKYRMWVDDITTGQSIRLDDPRGRSAPAPVSWIPMHSPRPPACCAGSLRRNRT